MEKNYIFNGRCEPFRTYKNLIICITELPEGTKGATCLGKGTKKQKKIWIYPYLGEWVVQDGDNIHKKQKNHAFKIHFRPF